MLAAHVTRLLVNSRVVVNAMEPRAAIGIHDPASGRFTLHAPSQGAFGMRGNMAEILKVEPKQVRILTGHVGGSFGMKSAPFPEYVCVLHAARALGRPVKWTDERSGSFVSDSHGRDHDLTAELALDADGTFLALRITNFGNMGGFLAQVAPMPPRSTRSRTQSVYRTPLIEFRPSACSPTPRTSPPIAALAGQAIITWSGDRCGGGRDGIDRLELRRATRSGRADRSRRLGSTCDSGDFPVCSSTHSRSPTSKASAAASASRKRGKIREARSAAFSK